MVEPPCALTALGHVEHGAGDALGVDAAVGVERLVLLRDDGIAHRLGDLREIDALAVAVPARGHHLGVVGPVVDVVLRRGALVDDGNAHHGVGEAGGTDQTAEERDAQSGDEPPGRHPAVPPRPCRGAGSRSSASCRAPRRALRPAEPPGAPRRPPRPGSAALRRPPPLRCAARRASARLPYARSSFSDRTSRTETLWRLAVPHGGRRTSRTDRVGPRHVRLLRLRRFATVLAHRTTNSSGRRTFARLVKAAGFRSPEVRMRPLPHSPVLHRGQGRPQTSLGSRWSAWRTHYAPSKPRGPKFTSNQATCSR